MDFHNEMRRESEPFTRGAGDGRFSPGFTPACAQKRGNAGRGAGYSGDGTVRGAENGGVRGKRVSCKCAGKGSTAVSESVQQAINTLPLAMVYSPEQSFTGIKELACALEAGTIFDALDKPFCGARVRGGNR